ncbi:MAG: hemolysin family protein, partial [Actinomycetota bacterium]
GFFVAVEFALVAADRSKLEAEAAAGSLPAKAAVSARRRLSFHLSGAQLGITVTSLVIGFLSESTVAELLAPVLEPFPFLAGPTMSIVIALAVATVFQMLLGELIPKTIAVALPEQTSRLLAPIALVVHGALSPIIRVLNGAANWTVRKMGMEPQEELEDVRSLQELQYIIQSSGAGGGLTPTAQDLLTRTIRFGEKTAADALTPRVHVVALRVDDPATELVVKASETNFSRFPVFAEDLDDIRGVVDIQRVFGLSAEERATVTASGLMVDPIIVPETKDLVDIVADFRTTEAQIAVVVDEHGGTAGILTLEDVLEEIVGEVDDEYDESTSLTIGVAPGIFLLAGTLHPDEVEEACGLVVPEGEYETLAGFILVELGRIPKVGDGLTFEGWRIRVAEMDGLRIASLRVTAPPDETEVPGGVQAEAPGGRSADQPTGPPGPGGAW